MRLLGVALIFLVWGPTAFGQITPEERAAIAHHRQTYLAAYLLRLDPELANFKAELDAQAHVVGLARRDLRGIRVPPGLLATVVELSAIAQKYIEAMEAIANHFDHPEPYLALLDRLILQRTAADQAVATVLVHQHRSIDHAFRGVDLVAFEQGLLRITRETPPQTPAINWELGDPDIDGHERRLALRGRWLADLRAYRVTPERIESTLGSSARLRALRSHAALGRAGIPWGSGLSEDSLALQAQYQDVRFYTLRSRCESLIKTPSAENHIELFRGWIDTPETTDILALPVTGDLTLGRINSLGAARISPLAFVDPDLFVYFDKRARLAINLAAHDAAHLSEQKQGWQKTVLPPELALASNQLLWQLRSWGLRNFEEPRVEWRYFDWWHEDPLRVPSEGLGKQWGLRTYDPSIPLSQDAFVQAFATELGRLKHSIPNCERYLSQGLR